MIETTLILCFLCFVSRFPCRLNESFVLLIVFCNGFQTLVSRSVSLEVVTDKVYIEKSVTVLITFAVCLGIVNQRLHGMLTDIAITFDGIVTFDKGFTSQTSLFLGFCLNSFFEIDVTNTVKPTNNSVF